MIDSPRLVNEMKQISLANSLYDGVEDSNIRQITYLLVNKNANPNIIIPDKGISPLHFVAGIQPENFAVEVTKLFLLHDGDPNVRTVEGVTPAHIAAAWGQVTLLQLLLKSGADPRVCDDEGLSPLDYATREQHEGVVELLKQFSNPENQGDLSDNNPPYSLLLEKVIIQEGDFSAEYAVDPQVETRSTSTQTDSQPTVVTNRGDLTSHVPDVENGHDGSWDRVARWCQQQSLLVAEDPNTPMTSCKSEKLSPTPSESISNVAGPTSEHQQYLSVPNKALFPHSPTLSPTSQFPPSPSGSRLTPSETTPSRVGSENRTTSSEIFFTCESHKQTSSSQVSSVVSEVYRYTDKLFGVVLIEKRMSVASGTSATEMSETDADAKNQRKLNSIPQRLNAVSSGSSLSSLPTSAEGYCTERLRRELQSRGFSAGPITDSTKRVYVRRLARLRKGGPDPTTPSLQTPLKFSRELERSIRDLKSLDLTGGLALEQRMCEQFSRTAPGRCWREGVGKSSFTYLLLDPRVSQNLPLRAASLSPDQRWSAFLNAIFYVGKGKRARPYSHLYQAASVWGGRSSATSKKVDRIVDIWREGQGVVCLHVFQSIIAVEAYTREAAMIDAIGLENLCNLKRGEYYGVMACKSRDQRCQLGVYLLYRALHVLLHEGERQLQPIDIA